MSNFNYKKKRLLFLVNDSRFFVSHRLPIAVAALEKGYEVHVATPMGDCVEIIKEAHLHYHPINLKRSGKNLFTEIRFLGQLFFLIKKIKPDVIHNVTIKPVIYGTLFATLLSIPKRINAISGMGFMFMHKNFKQRCLRQLIIVTYRLLLIRPKTKTIFQNPNDRDFFLNRKIVTSQNSSLIKGAGVDLSHYAFKPEPCDKKMVITLPARMLKDKGVFEFVGAAKILGAKYNVLFQLAGDIDLENPSGIKREIIEAWQDLPFIKWLGFQSDMVRVYHGSHIICLPSYREGMPKVLLEAASCGRPIVTTNVPGCRQAIIPGKTGLLVNKAEVDSLVVALEKLINDKALRQSMGYEGRQLATREYAVDSVIEKTLALYEC